jgi:DNA-binding response OmpR family regulator
MDRDLLLLRLLVVEDEERMRDLLCRGLRDAGHTVMPACDGRSGLELALEFDFDVIILDIGMPFLDGFELTRALRGLRRAVPILMLTARDTEEEILRGFDAGTDDYLIKPFSFRELSVRLQRLAARSGRKADTTGLVLDRDRLAVLDAGRLISLSRSEFLLLACLLDNPGATTPRERLVEAVWGSHRAVNPNALEVLVNAVRSRLHGPDASATIATVRGVGYRLDAARMGPARWAGGGIQRGASA